MWGEASPSEKASFDPHMVDFVNRLIQVEVSNGDLEEHTLAAAVVKSLSQVELMNRAVGWEHRRERLDSCFFSSFEHAKSNVAEITRLSQKLESSNVESFTRTVNTEEERCSRNAERALALEGARGLERLAIETEEVLEDPEANLIHEKRALELVIEKAMKIKEIEMDILKTLKASTEHVFSEVAKAQQDFMEQQRPNMLKEMACMREINSGVQAQILGSMLEKKKAKYEIHQENLKRHQANVSKYVAADADPTENLDYAAALAGKDFETTKVQEVESEQRAIVEEIQNTQHLQQQLKKQSQNFSGG